jgi:hypothetical protein
LTSGSEHAEKSRLSNILDIYEVQALLAQISCVEAIPARVSEEFKRHRRCYSLRILIPTTSIKSNQAVKNQSCQRFANRLYGIPLPYSLTYFRRSQSLWDRNPVFKSQLKQSLACFLRAPH